MRLEIPFNRVEQAGHHLTPGSPGMNSYDTQTFPLRPPVS